VLLETARLRLRRFTSADAERLYALDSDPEVTRYVRLTPDASPTPLAVIREEMLPRFMRIVLPAHGLPGYWAAEERASGDFLGWFHLRPAGDDPTELELGYRLRRAAWGRGYATEGARALVALAFTRLGARRVTATALVENAASIRVLEKAGLRFEERFVYPGSTRVGVRYGLGRDEGLGARG
jgi:RimJ/RimL family protein N-acetyltransferase